MGMPSPRSLPGVGWVCLIPGPTGWGGPFCVQVVGGGNVQGMGIPQGRGEGQVQQKEGQVYQRRVRVYWREGAGIPESRGGYVRVCAGEGLASGRYASYRNAFLFLNVDSTKTVKYFFTNRRQYQPLEMNGTHWKPTPEHINNLHGEI